MTDVDEYKGYNDGQKAALRSSGNVLVSASAGSGKTTVMVEKIFRLIKSGADVKRMVVMTFTRAAASEMKNRLLKKLYAALRNDEAGEHVRRQIESFPFTNIGTIDSFCYGLIQKYFGVIGADPSSTPYEEGESDRIISECIDKVCEERLESEDEDFMGFAGRYAYKRKLDSVKGLIAMLRNFAATQPEGEEILFEDKESVRNDYFLDYARGPLNGMIADGDIALAMMDRPGMRQFEEKAVIIRNNLVALQQTKTIDEFFETFRFLTKEKSTRKTVGIDPEAKELYNYFVTKYSDYYKNLSKYVDVFFNNKNRIFAQKDVKTLVEVTLQADKLYVARKKRDKKLDFADMGKLALRILEDPQIRQEVKDSFDYIFVDEYQDTNYLQEELLSGISNGNNVFVVGDVKQAIYHFRAAEPDIFRLRKKRFETGADGHNVNLNENYRSGEEILDFVNMVCSEVMTEDYCGINYRADGIMKAGASIPGSSVEIYTVEKEEEEKKEVKKGVYSVKDAPVKVERDVQNEFVADYIMRNVGKTVFYSNKEKKEKVLGYGDVAILVRRNRTGKDIADELAKSGIPYSIDKADEGVDVGRELLIDFIRVCYGSDDLSVLNVMMSPLFDLSASELASIKANEQKTTLLEAAKSYNGNPELQIKVSKFLDYVAELRHLASVLKISEVMTKVLADGLEGYYVAQGGDAAIRIKRFVATVSNSDVDEDVTEFLQFCDKYVGEKPPVRKDSVIITTIHKSKGLEYPFVIIPHIDSNLPRGGGKDPWENNLRMDRELGVALIDSNEETGYTGKSFATMVMDLKKSREERQELARLMYVAFTRAENRLILISGKKKEVFDIDSASSFDGFISYAEGKNPAISKFRMEYIPPEVKAATPPIRDEEGDYDYLLKKYAFTDATTTSLKTTVSEILDKEERVTRAFALDVKHDSSSAALGTAYHLIMQKIDLSTKSTEAISAFVKDLVEAGEIDADVAKVIDVEKIAKLLDSDVIKGAVGKKIHREVPFLMPYGDNGGLLQGVIDLLIEEDDGLTVVDYKASYADEETLRSRYARQIELYSTAAERILNKPVKAGILLNLMRSYEVRI